MRLRPRFPDKGLNLSFPNAEQPPRTTRLGRNVRLRCPVTGRRRGARRAGMSRFVDTAADSAKIQDGVSINVDNKLQTYTAYGASAATQDWAQELPSSQEAYCVRSDGEGNGYWTDPPNGVVKLNPDGEKVWRIAPAVADELHEIRAIAVDDSGWIFCGVSTGGKQESARLFGYQEQEDDKCTVVWTLTLGMYVRALHIHNDELYALISDDSLKRGLVYVYSSPMSGVPVLVRSWRVPYPVNSFDVAEESGAIVTAHEAATPRNTDPASLIASSWWVDWNPTKLDSFDKRLWAWLSADDIDGDGTHNSEYADGDEILVWYDKGPAGRNLYKNNMTSSPSDEYGPTLRKLAWGGRDVLVFNGEDESMASDASVSTTSPGSSRLDRAGQRTLIPNYDGAQFVLVMVVKCSVSEAIGVLLGQAKDDSTSPDEGDWRGLVVNQRAGTTFATALSMSRRPGTVMWKDPINSAGANANGPNGHPLCGWTGGDGSCVITVVHGAGFTDSTVRINGRPIDHYTGDNHFKGTDPTFLAWSRGITASTTRQRFAGLVMEILVLSDWYEDLSDPLGVPVRETLIELPTNADPISDWDSTLTHVTEIERLEGWAMHRWGVAHKAPIGTFNAIYFSPLSGAGTAGVKPSNNDTLTINGRTYTWKTTLSGAADEIKISGTATNAGGIEESAWNLMQALNGTGTPGTDYGLGTDPNDDVLAIGVGDWNDNSGNSTAFDTVAVVITSRDTSNTRLATTESTTGARTVWEEASTYAATSDTDNIGDSYGNTTQHPHRFYLTKVASAGTLVAGTATGCYGGPPRADSKLSTSQYQDLSSPYPMVCKWDPVSARLRWVCTSNLSGDATNREAIGYGVKCSSADLVFCSGPRSTGYGSGTYDIRCIVDNKDSFSEAAGDGAWTVALDATTTWTTPLLDRDKDDNVYIPWHSTDMEECAFVYTKAGTQLHAITATGLNLGFAIAHVPNYPDYGDDLDGTGQATAPRAEHVYVAGRLENTATATWSATPVAGAEVHQFSALVLGSPTTVSEGVSFVAALTTDGDVLVETGGTAAENLSDTLDNTVALINGGAGDGVVYQAYSSASSQLVRALSKTATAISFRAINPVVDPTDVFSIPYAVQAQSAGGTAVWTGLVTVGVNTYLGAAASSAMKFALVHSVLTTGSPRRMVTLVVCNDTIYWDNAGTWTAVVDGVFAQSSQYVQCASLFQKVYFTNGDETLVVDCKPATPTCEALSSTKSGSKPPRCKLVETWRGRLVMSRTPDDAHNWYMSAVGEPTDWDTSPPVVSPTQAVVGNNTLAGRVPDIVNAIAPYNDDFLFFGGDHTIYRLSGDPMAGGQLDLISDSVGMAFGRPYCMDHNGVFYFFGARGGLFRLTGGTTPEDLSHDKLGNVWDDLDLSSYYVRLIWNEADHTIHIYLFPYGAGGTQLEHYVYEKDTEAFWQDTFGTSTDTDVQPTSMWISDGDDPGDRKILLGCEDGIVRTWDPDALNDDSTLLAAVDAEVMMGPYMAADGFTARLRMVQCALAKDQQACELRIWKSFTPDEPDDLAVALVAPAGMSNWMHVSVKGAYIWVSLSSASPYVRWAFESLLLDIYQAGRTQASV